MKISEKEKIFREIYSDYYPLVFNAVYSRINSIEDTEDICHELFIQYYNKFEEVNDSRKWLMGSVKYIIANYYRSKRTKGPDSTDIDAIENDINLSFENGARDVRIILHDALENEDNYETEHDRIVFELISFNNYTLEQTGKQLGLSVHQVRYRYDRTLRKILAYLKSKGISDIGDVL